MITKCDSKTLTIPTVNMYGRLIVMSSGKVKLMTSRILTFGKANDNKVRLKNINDPYFAMLTVDSNNKAWLKYIGQSVGTVWTVVNGTKISHAHLVPIFHLCVFNLGDVNFRFELASSLVAFAQTQSVTLEGCQQVDVVEEIQTAPDTTVSDTPKVASVSSELMHDKEEGKVMDENGEDLIVDKKEVESPYGLPSQREKIVKNEDKEYKEEESATEMRYKFTESTEKQERKKQKSKEDIKGEEDEKMSFDASLVAEGEKKSLEGSLVVEEKNPKEEKRSEENNPSEEMPLQRAKRPRSVSIPVEEPNRKKRRSCNKSKEKNIFGKWESDTWGKYWTPVCLKRSKTINQSSKNIKRLKIRGQNWRSGSLK